MTRSLQRNHRISICALIGGLALASSAWAGPFAGAGFGAGGYAGAGFGHNVAAGGFGAGGYGGAAVGHNLAAGFGAGGSGDIGLGHGVAADGIAGGRFDGQIARPRDAAQPVRKDVNGAVQTQHEVAGQTDAATSAAGSATARPGRPHARASAGAQTDTQAEVSR